MRLSISLFLVFSVPLIANATDLNQCQFSFHAIDSNGNINSQPYLTSNEILSTEKRFSRQLQKEVIYLKFTEKGTKVNNDYTSSNIGKYFAVFCNDTLLVKPRILEVIQDEAVFTLK